MSDGIKVAIRMRPLIQRERQGEQAQSRWQVQNNTVSQLDEKGHNVASYTFDRVFDECDTTNDLYEDIVAPIVSSAMAGFHGTVFAYGQTSSGKTFTMVGSKLQPGIIPCAIEAVFDAIQNTPEREFLLRSSYLEIYNEKISDLLSQEEKSLKIHLDQNFQPSVPNLTEKIVTCSEDALDILKEGNARKRVGETTQNDKSSRSHCIYKMVVESRERVDDSKGSGEEAVMVSHLNFVDLAGSEKAGENSGERLKEGCAINRSLFCLSNVISKLSEGEQEFINYRDSKLTRILQNALGGNSKTAIICTATPASLEETHSTLRFASRAKVIKNKPLRNEVLSDAALIKRYKKEIDRLKKQLAVQEAPTQASVDSELRQQLEEKERKHREELDKLKKLFCVSTLPSPDDCPVPSKKLRRETWCPGRRRPSVGFMMPPLVTQRGTDNSLDKLHWSRPDFGNTSSFDFLDEMDENIKNPQNLLSIPEENELEVTNSSLLPAVKMTAETCSQTDPFLLNLPADHSEQEFEDLKSQLEQSMNICEKLLTEREHKEKQLQEAQQEVLQLSEKVTDLEDQLIRVTCHLDRKEQEFKELEEFTRYEKEFRTPQAKRIKLSPDSKSREKLEEEILIQQKNATDAETVVMETRKELAISNDNVKDLEKLLAETKKQLDQLSKEKADFDYLLEHEKEKSEKLQKDLRVELQAAYEEIRQLEQTKSAGLIKKNDPLLHQLHELQEKVGNLDVSVVLSERDELKEQLSDARVAMQTAEEECQEKTNECSALMAELMDLKESVKELSSDLLDSQDECFKLVEQLDSAKKELEDKSQLLEKLQSHSGTSAENDELVENSKARDDSSDDSLASSAVTRLQRELEERTAVIFAGKEELKQSLEKVESLTEENEILLEKYTDLEERLIAAAEEEENLNKKIQKLTEGLDAERNSKNREKPDDKECTMKETVSLQENKIQTLSEMLREVQEKLTAASEEVDRERQNYAELETKYLLIVEQKEERLRSPDTFNVLNSPSKPEEDTHSSFSRTEKLGMDCTEEQDKMKSLQDNEMITEADRLKQLLAEKEKCLEEQNKEINRKEDELMESNKKLDSLMEEYETLLKTQPMDSNQIEDQQNQENSINEQKEVTQRPADLVHVQPHESETTSSDSDETSDIMTHRTSLDSRRLHAEKSSRHSELTQLQTTLQEQEAHIAEMKASLKELKDIILEKEEEVVSLTKAYEDLLSEHKQCRGRNVDISSQRDKSLSFECNQADNFAELKTDNSKEPELIDNKSDSNTIQSDGKEVAGLKETVERQKLLDMYDAVEKSETELVESKAALNELQQKYSDLLEKMSEKIDEPDVRHMPIQHSQQLELEEVCSELEKTKAELQIACERIGTLERLLSQGRGDEDVTKDLTCTAVMKDVNPIMDVSVQTETLNASEGKEQKPLELQEPWQNYPDGRNQIMTGAEGDLCHSQSELAEAYVKLTTLQAKYDELVAQHDHLLTGEKQRIKVQYESFVQSEENEYIDDDQSYFGPTAKSGIEQSEQEFVTHCKKETGEISTQDTCHDVEIAALRKVIHEKQIELAEAVDALERVNDLLQESQNTAATLKTEKEQLQAKYDNLQLGEASQTEQCLSRAESLHWTETHPSDVQVIEERYEVKTTEADLQASIAKLTALQSQYDELYTSHQVVIATMEASSAASDLIEALEKSKADLQASNEKLTALQSQYDELKTSHQALVATMEASSGASDLIDALEKAKADLQASNEKLTALQSQYDDLQTSHQAALATMEASSGASDLIDALEKAKAELQASNEKLTALQSQYDKLKTSHQAVLATMEASSAASDFEALEKAKADLQASNEKLTALQSQYDELKTSHQAVIATMEASSGASDLIDALEKAKADLQASNEKLTALQSQFDELQTSHQAALATMEASSGASDLIDALEQAKADLQASNEKLTALQSQYDKLKTSHQAVVATMEASSAASDFEALEKAKADLQASNEKLTALQSQYDELKTSHQAVIATMEASSGASDLIDALEKAKADLQASNEKLTALQSQFDELQTSHQAALATMEASSGASDLIDALEKAKADLQASNEKLTALQSQYDKLKTSHQAVVATMEASSAASDFEALEKAKADLQASNEKLTALQSQYDELKTSHQAVIATMEASSGASDLIDALEKAKAELQASNEKLTALQFQYDKLKTSHQAVVATMEASSAASDFEALEKAKADLQASNEKLTALQSQYDELQTSYQAALATMEESSLECGMKEALDKAVTDLQASNEKLTSLQSQYDELQALHNSKEPVMEVSSNVSELREALNRAMADSQASNEKLTAMQSQYDELQTSHQTALTTMEASSGASDLIEALEKAKADLQASNEKLTALQSQYDELKTSHQAALATVEASSGALEKSKADLQASNEKLTALQSQYDELYTSHQAVIATMEASSGASDLIDALEKAKADLQVSNEKLTALQSQYDELQTSHQAVIATMEASSAASDLIEALEKSKADLQASNEKLTALQSQYDELQTSHQAVLATMEKSSLECGMKEALDKAVTDLQASNEKLTSLQSQYDELQALHNSEKTVMEVSDYVSELKEALDRAMADSQASNEKLTALQSQYDELQTSHQAVVATMEASSPEGGMKEVLNKVMTDLRALQSQCDQLLSIPSSKEPFVEVSFDVSELKQALDKAMANLQASNEKLSTLQSQYDELQGFYGSKQTSADVETSALSKALNKAIRDLQSRDETLAELQVKYDELRSIHQLSAHAVEDSANIYELREALDKAKSDLQASHDQLAVLKAQHDDAISSLECKLTSKSSEIAAELKTAKADFEHCNEKLKDLQSRYDELGTKFQDVPSREDYMAEKVSHQEMTEKLKSEVTEKTCALDSTKTELCQCKAMLSEQELQLASLMETMKEQEAELTVKTESLGKLEKELQVLTENFADLQREHEETLEKHAKEVERTELKLLENSKKLAELRSACEEGRSVEEDRNSLVDQVEKLKLELSERNSALAKAEEEVEESVRKQNDLNSQHEALLEKYIDLQQKETEVQQLLQSTELLKTEISEDLTATKEQLESLKEKYKQEKSCALQEQNTLVTSLQEEVEQKASLLLLSENQLKELQAKLDTKLKEYNNLYERHSEITKDMCSKEARVTKMSSEIELKDKELEDKRMEIKSLEKGFEALETELRGKYERAVKELESSRKSLERTEGKLEELVAKERAQDKQYNRMATSSELAQEKVQVLSEKCARLESQVAIQKEKTKDLEADKRKLEEELKLSQGKVEAMCVESSSALQQQLEKFQQCSKLQQELKDAVHERDQLQSQLDNLNKTQSEKSCLQNQLSHIMSALEDLRQNKNHLQAKLTKAQAENEKLKSASQSECNKAELEAELHRLKDELHKAKQEAQQKGGLQTELSDKEADLDELRKEVTCLQHTCKTLKDQLEQKTLALDKAKSDCEAKQSTIQKMKSYLSGQKPMEEMILKMELRDLKKENDRLKKGIQMRIELQSEADATIMSRDDEIVNLKEEITALREKSSSQSINTAQLEELAQMKMKVFGLESDLKIVPEQYEKRIASLTETVEQKNNHIASLKQEMRRLNEQVSANDTICFLKENDRKPSASTSAPHPAEDSTACDRPMPEVLYAGRSGIVDSDSIYILQSQNGRLQKENSRLLAKLESYKKHAKQKGLRSPSKLEMKENTISVTQKNQKPVSEDKPVVTTTRNNSIPTVVTPPKLSTSGRQVKKETDTNPTVCLTEGKSSTQKQLTESLSEPASTKDSTGKDCLLRRTSVRTRSQKSREEQCQQQ